MSVLMTLPFLQFFDADEESSAAYGAALRKADKSHTPDLSTCIAKEL